jgi:ABC-type phosphate transport system substrate-binding protein
MLVPTPAHAAFTLAPCAGSSVAGQGSSFQKGAQAAWAASFDAACSPFEQPPGSIAITYTANGSGAGLASLGANPTGDRDAATRFAGTDDAPTTAQIAQIAAGPAGGATGAGRIRTIPVATGAIALIVNAPDGCAIPAGAAYGATRFHVSSPVLEQAWAGAAATWGDVLGRITETAGGGRAAGSCAAQPLIRVVRFDTSGTTLQLKRWLDHVDPAARWTALGNTEWPGATVNAGAKGGGALAALVAATDGSLGYVDLATARANGFEASETAPDDTFWLPLDDNTGAPAEPTADPLGYVQGTTARGANCEAAEFSGEPGGADPTLGDWSAVTGAGAPAGYPLCLLTFELVWDDAATVYAATPAEQASARTVKDYLSEIVGATGQATLAPGDYAGLPANLRDVAAGGVAQIDFAR